MYCFIVVALKAWGHMRCGGAATRRTCNYKYRLFMTIDQHHDLVDQRKSLMAAMTWAHPAAAIEWQLGQLPFVSLKSFTLCSQVWEIPTIHLKMIKPVHLRSDSLMKTLKDLRLNILPLASSLPLDSLSKTYLWTPWDSFLPPKASPGAPSAQHVGVGPDTWICPELIPWKKYSDVFSIFMWISVGHTICLHGFCLLVVFKFRFINVFALRRSISRIYLGIGIQE